MNHASPQAGWKPELSRSTSWCTKSGDSLRTTGAIVELEGEIEFEDVLSTISRWAIGPKHKAASPDFGGNPAATGKFVVINRLRVAVLQVLPDGEILGCVPCGNAMAAAAGYCAVVAGASEAVLSSTGSDGAEVSVEATVQRRDARLLVRSNWRLPARRVSTEWTNDERGDTLTISGPLPYEVVFLRDRSLIPSECPKPAIPTGKTAFVVADEDGLPWIQVASCGRWHQGLPLTGAIALALAARERDDIGTALCHGVRHARGTESLPRLVADPELLRFELPPVEVVFAPASRGSLQ